MARKGFFSVGQHKLALGRLLAEVHPTIVYFSREIVRKFASRLSYNDGQLEK